MKRLFLVSFVAFASFVIASARVRAEVIEQILVRVNGEVLTKSDLEARQADALRELGQDVDPKKLGDAQLRAALDKVTPQVMAGVVDEMLLLQRGKELGYKLSDEQFTSVLDSIKKDRKLDTDEQFQQALKDSNMTLADLRRQVEKSVVMDRVRQNEVLSKIAISDEEARRYYDAHKNEFTKPQEITLREILVAVPAGAGNTINVGADNEAKDKAAALRARALAGESYEKLAADFSDSPSKSNAGLIGPISSTDVSPDLRKLFDAMKVGDITQPLRIPTGYQILKLESRSDAQTAPFEQAKDQISDRVFTGKRKDEYEKYMEKLRAQAIIDWKNPDLKKAYDIGVQQVKDGTAPLK
jgi:peptidyl-prolyl cis-trans isomerase SurA